MKIDRQSNIMILVSVLSCVEIDNLPYVGFQDKSQNKKQYQL